MGQIEVYEDGPNDEGIGKEGEDPHLAATARTQEGQHLVDPSEKLGPADSRRAITWGPRWAFGARTP